MRSGVSGSFSFFLGGRFPSAPAAAGAMLGIQAVVRDAAVRILHELFQPILKLLIAARPEHLRARRGDDVLHGLLAAGGLGTARLRPGLRRGGRLHPLDGEVDLPLVADAHHAHLHRLPELHMVMHIADEAVGHLGDVHQTALSAGQGDKGPELGDPCHPSFHNASNFQSHTVSSLSAPRWTK